MGIKNKIALIVSLLFSVLLITSAALLVHVGEANIRHTVVTGQAALVKTLVYGFDEQVSERHRAVIQVARGITPGMVADHRALQSYLQSQVLLTSIFKTTLVQDQNGTVIAAVPQPLRYVGTRKIARQEHVLRTFATRKPCISKLFVSPISNQPLIVMTAPVFDKTGKVMAIVSGSQYILTDNLFTGFTKTRIGRTGSLAMITRDRVVIAHPDKRRVMTVIKPGASKALEEALRRSHFSGEAVSSNGEPMVTTIDTMNSTGWLVGASLPLKEAYAPVATLRRNVYRTLVILLVALTVLVWVTTNLLTHPLVALRDRIREMGKGAASDDMARGPRTDEIGEVEHAFNVLITARQAADAELHRLNRALRMLSDVNQVLLRVSNEEELLNAVCRVVVEVGGYRMAWVGYAEHGPDKLIRPVGQYGVEEGYLSVSPISWGENELGGGPAARAIRSGTTQLDQIFLDDPALKLWHAAAQRLGFRSVIALPLMHNGTALGMLGMYGREVNAFFPEEVKLLEELAGDLAFGIVVMKAREQGKRSEEALRASELKYHSLWEESMDGLFITSPGGKITDINRKGVELFGYASKEELYALDLATDIYAHDSDRRKIVDMVAREGHGEYDVAVKRKNGEVLLTHCSMTAVYDNSGTPICYRGSIRDVTELHRAHQALAESEACFRVMSEEAVVGVAIHYGDSFAYVNPVFATMLGYSIKEMMRLRPVDLIAPHDREFATTQITDRLSGVLAPGHYEMSAVTKDGENKDIDMLAGLIEYKGRPAMLCTIVDITERKRKDADLQRYREHLEELVQQRTEDLVHARNAAEAANLAKSTFLANMSHELRTPLNAVLGFSSLMRADIGLTEKQYKTLDIINRSGEHLLELINDILDVARIESGKMSLTLEPCDLGEMIRDITDMIRPRAEEKGLTLHFDQTSEFPRFVRIDSGKLRQVLINLVINAVKYTDRGNVTFRVDSVRQSHSTHMLTFDVHDTGPGISAEDQQRIFEPFEQVLASHARKGSGLGLTITRQYVELMGGTITLDSRLGEGSSFRVMLPAEIASEEEVASISLPHGRVIGVAPGQSEYRILIVEDDQVNSLLLSRLIEAAGLSSRTVVNGEEAVKVFAEWQPQIIWMDRQMPLMDGLAATRIIRSMDGGKDVTIIGLTASAFADQRQESLDSGMDDFVRKPYRATEIYDCLERHLGVKFVYDAMSDPPTLEHAALPTALAELSPELREQLLTAILGLDADEIASTIEAISDASPQIGLQLSAYMERLAFTPILHALQELQSGSEA